MKGRNGKRKHVEIRLQPSTIFKVNFEFQLSVHQKLFYFNLALKSCGTFEKKDHQQMTVVFSNYATPEILNSLSKNVSNAPLTHY